MKESLLRLSDALPNVPRPTRRKKPVEPVLDGLKTCGLCGVRKPGTEYNLRRDTKQATFRGACKDCCLEYNKIRKTGTNEQRLAGARQWKMANAEAVQEYNLKYLREHRWYFVMREIRSRCRKKSIAYDLDEHKFKMQERFEAGVCEMTGIAFYRGNGLRYNSASIDRINPENGYTYDNVRVVLWCMNAAMNRWGEDVLREVMTVWLAKTKEN